MPTAMERKLYDLLLEDRIVAEDSLKAALQRQKETGDGLVRALIDMGAVSEWEMAAALGKQLNVPFITLSHYEIDREILECIPEDLVRKYRIVPIDRTDNVLTVALSDPSNIYLLDELRLLTRCQIVPVISFESDINEAIERYYLSGGRGESSIEEALKDITEEDISGMDSDEISLNDDGGGEEENNLSVEADDAPVVQLVNNMVMEAIKMKASDIHIEPYEKLIRLRYRVDGVLQEMPSPPKKFQNAIISRIKIMSKLDIAEKRLPQDGRFRVKLADKAIDFRVSVCPMSFGEKVVMRILDQSNLQLQLTDLGLTGDDLIKLESNIKKPWGMCLITGPTGSGKSTTLYSALSTINDPTKNISTVEDPVEYQLPGINQVNVQTDFGLTFAAGLKSFLRQDPDIIMVGEIRDIETGEIAIKAALTGHLVLSTLHTNDAPSSISRLTNMGIEPFMVTASLNMVVAQRLVRKICAECKEEFKPLVEMLENLGMHQFKGDEIFCRGKGCQTCGRKGLKGRLALYEIMVMNDHLRNAVIEGATTNLLKKEAIKHDMITLRMAGVRKILEGRTTVEEVLGATVKDEI